MATSGRDPATGKWLPGHKGIGGRPRGLDFRAIVMERAAATGISIEDAVWVIFRSMLKQASEGDVQAAKFIAEKLCDTEPLAVHVTGYASGPPAPDGLDMTTWAKRLAALVTEDEARTTPS